MGLTLECSRCHDHKFDPLTQKDYFQLQAVFAASSRKTIPVVSSLSAGHRREDYHRMIALTEARASYQRFEKQVKDRVIEIKKKDYPPEVVRAYEVPMKERTARELELAAPLTQFYTAMEIANHLTDEEKKHHQDHIRKLATSRAGHPSRGRFAPGEVRRILRRALGHSSGTTSSPSWFRTLTC